MSTICLDFLAKAHQHVRICRYFYLMLRKGGVRRVTDVNEYAFLCVLLTFRDDYYQIGTRKKLFIMLFM